MRWPAVVSVASTHWSMKARETLLLLISRLWVSIVQFLSAYRGGGSPAHSPLRSPALFPKVARSLNAEGRRCQRQGASHTNTSTKQQNGIKKQKQQQNKKSYKIEKSNIAHRISNIEHRVSNVGYRTSKFEHRISNTWYLASNIEK